MILKETEISFFHVIISIAKRQKHLVWVKFLYALLHDKLLINRDKTGAEIFCPKIITLVHFILTLNFHLLMSQRFLMSEIRLSRSRMLCMGGRVNRISRISDECG